MKRIMVMDDDENVRKLLTTILSDEGYDVESASNGLQGGKLQHEKPFDLVVTDLFMPGKDGIEIIQEIRNDYPGTRIIAISGGGNVGDVDLLKVSRALGADLVLTKPFMPDDLLEAVGKLLS